MSKCTLVKKVTPKAGVAHGLLDEACDRLGGGFLPVTHPVLVTAQRFERLARDANYWRLRPRPQVPRAVVQGGGPAAARFGGQRFPAEAGVPDFELALGGRVGLRMPSQRARLAYDGRPPRQLV